MMATQRTTRRGLIWAVVGAVVLLAGVAAVVVVALTTRAPDPTPMTSPPGEPTQTTSPAEQPTDAVVDAGATDRGWIPEPITTDPAAYVEAALAAASTFDTTRSSREEWLDYLDTWFTPDTRYTDPADQIAAMESSKVELRLGVVLPEADWDSLAGEDGRVIAVTSSAVELEPVPEDLTDDMRIGTADVTLTFVRGDGSGGETAYDETVRVSVQVLCGPGSVPTPSSAQRVGDCKVIRYFSGTQEP